MKEKIVYLSGLNGIRAIAAIAVVFSHIILNLEDFGLYAHFLGTQANGNPQTWNLAGYGVSMFFTLSGFLITYLLWTEKEKQPIQIKKFYLRRILRIWPLYYTYMILCFIVYFIFSIEYNTDSIYYYLFYGANIPFIIGGGLPFLGHFWSLGVEEQFYMFWPWVNKLKKKNIILFVISLITLLISAKIYLHFFIPNSLLESIIHVTRFHCMLIGALAAILYKNENKLFITITTNKLAQLISWGVMILVAINQFHIASFLDNEFITTITTIIIIGQITKKGLISLENPILDFLGKISYGIYVIHPLLIFLFSKILKEITPFPILNYFIVFTSILSATIILSHLSYKYLEAPFLRLKNKKFTVINSSGTRETIPNKD